MKSGSPTSVHYCFRSKHVSKHPAFRHFKTKQINPHFTTHILYAECVLELKRRFRCDGIREHNCPYQMSYFGCQKPAGN
jgi:hypothetical protein